jgi:hypothetical protein
LATPEARPNFYLAKREFYQRLGSRELPGGNWFRHQVNLAEKELASGPKREIARRWDRDWQRDTDLERTFSLLSGGRDGLLNVLTKDEILDLHAFVEAGGFRLPEHL